MYSTSDIRELHIEITERCNAHCPMCGRFSADGAINPNLANRDLSREFLDRALPVSFIRQLERVRLCGNFGDPAAGSEALEICEFFRERHPGVLLSFHTNGGLREHSWWRRLGRLFRDGGNELVFALDGLGDTHSLYRRGVNFDRVIQNASTAIRAGARAVWVMLVFEHNEHQIEEAKKLAHKLGFASFRAKATKRFRPHKDSRPVTWEVREPGEVPLYAISPAKSDKYRHRDLKSKSSASSNGAIDCHVVRRGSVYISARGHLLPCCWVGSDLYPASGDRGPAEMMGLVERFGGMEQLSLSNRSVGQIISGDLFQHGLPKSWRDNGPSICASTCGSTNSAFLAQFVERVDFL